MHIKKTISDHKTTAGLATVGAVSATAFAVNRIRNQRGSHEQGPSSIDKMKQLIPSSRRR